MTRRIGYWALAGAAVAFLWFLYFTWLTCTGLAVEMVRLAFVSSALRPRH